MWLSFYLYPLHRILTSDNVKSTEHTTTEPSKMNIKTEITKTDPTHDSKWNSSFISMRTTQLTNLPSTSSARQREPSSASENTNGPSNYDDSEVGVVFMSWSKTRFSTYIAKTLYTCTCPILWTTMTSRCFLILHPGSHL